MEDIKMNDKLINDSELENVSGGAHDMPERRPDERYVMTMEGREGSGVSDTPNTNAGNVTANVNIWDIAVKTKDKFDS